MAEDKLFAGIDIGSTAIRIAVGHRLASGERGERPQIQIVGAAEVPSEGVSRGVINSIEDAVSSVSACLEKVERMSGLPIESAWVAISGANAITQQSRGVIGVAKADGEIREDDIERAVEQARTVAAPVNYEILHVIPRTFTVDGQAGIKDPLGMNGIRLEVDTQIIHGLTAHVKNVTKCVYRTGVNLDRLVLGVLACAEAVTTPRQRDLGSAVVNIGGATTTVVVHEQGDILHAASIPLGSEHITADIAIGLRTNIDVAERVKIQFGSANAQGLNRKEVIDLKELGAPDGELVSLKYVAEIIQARVEEIFEKVDKELKKAERSGMLPAGAIMTGGGAKLPGITDAAKRILRLPASLGYPVGVTSITDRVNDLSFTTAIGLVQWGINETPADARRTGGFLAGLKPVGKAVAGFRKWFGMG